MFRSINDKSLRFDMHDICDKPLQLTLCSDSDLDL